MISVLILTKNEALDLPRCLGALRWCDDIHVFDSLSEDHTIEIARRQGVSVTQRKFDNYAGQRNAALGSLPFKHEWVLSVDADEEIPQGLVAEMRTFIPSAPADVVAARMRRRDYYQGRWLKHAQISPFYIRLVRPRRVHYEREINEILVTDGRVVTLREPFNHHPFSKGMAYWVERHNRYSTMEAERAVKERMMSEVFQWQKALFARDFNVRRRHQKGLFYRFPARPWLKLGYMLFWRWAVLDGGPGITYAILQAHYEYLIVLKERELLLKASGPP